MTAMQDPASDRLLSAATIWELAVKAGQGKFTLSIPYRQWMETAIADQKLDILPVTAE
jgi:PIN domain nuclease of toxin-antitoxin system